MRGGIEEMIEDIEEMREKKKIESFIEILGLERINLEFLHFMEKVMLKHI